MQGKYQDALAIMRCFRSKPDLFITITANPEWPEITEAIAQHSHLSNQDRDDIIVRVFRAKLKEILNDILNNHVLGIIVGYVYVIEFQKRGLPHAHLLLILHPKSKLDKNPQLYDQIISAQIPNPETQPKLHKLVEKHMIHGPCMFYKKCLRDGYCRMYFPKPFQSKTVNSPDGYAIYKRLSPQQGGFTCKCKWDENFVVDNRYVVSYNPPLLLKYNCHINVEYCATIGSIKYVYKYIYKGSDKAFISIQNEKQKIIRECDEFIECRYFGAAEACWRIFSFKMGKQYPTVKTLPVHLPQQQYIYFDENDNKNQDFENVETELTQYFANNKKEKQNPLSTKQLGFFHDETIRPHGFELLYHEYPQFYHWKKKQWHRRTPKTNRLKPIVSRMHYVNYAETERYYLRLLLLNKIGATSFDDLKTINKKEPCKTFKEAVTELGLLEDDTEFHHCLEEACEIITNCFHLRKLFATILNLNEVLDPLKLWTTFKDQLTSDIKYKYYKSHPEYTEQIYTQAMYNECLFQIEEMLMDKPEKSATLKDYGLPVPNKNDRINHISQPKIIKDELNFDEKIESDIVLKNIRLMNNEQQNAYNQIMNAVYPQNIKQSLPKRNNFFFLQAGAGTGKTFLAKTIASSIRSKGHIALCNATSGIAATLFIYGKTLHSRFKIPLNCTKSSSLTIKRQSIEAQLIRQAKIIIWDEAPMAHSDILFWLDRQLKDIMNNDELFGGKVLLLCGDFKQIPPVIPKASTNVIIKASIKKCKLFKYAKKLKLTKNERLRKQLREEKLNKKQQQKLKFFDEWINKIGNNSIKKYSDIDEAAVEIPQQFIMKNKTESDMINQIYDNINDYDCNAEYYLNRCILTPLNKSVDKINEICLDKTENEDEKIYKSFDSVGLDDCSALFSQEFLNSREFAGLPKHELKLLKKKKFHFGNKIY